MMQVIGQSYKSENLDNLFCRVNFILKHKCYYTHPLSKSGGEKLRRSAKRTPRQISRGYVRSRTDNVQHAPAIQHVFRISNTPSRISNTPPQPSKTSGGPPTHLPRKFSSVAQFKIFSVTSIIATARALLRVKRFCYYPTEDSRSRNQRDRGGPGAAEPRQFCRLDLSLPLAPTDIDRCLNIGDGLSFNCFDQPLDNSYWIKYLK